MANHYRNATGISLASLLACSVNHTAPRNLDAEVRELVQASEDANNALMRGDVDRYRQLIQHANDFVLMSPFGGTPSRGVNPKRFESLRTFFQDGVLQQELVRAYKSADMVVLVTIERAHVAVGNLPAQDWALRVTLVYRRDSAGWQLVHRHADPLAHGISVQAAATLGRGN